MNTIELRKKILEGLWSIPLLDVHTHLDADHLTARGLHDILLYHMVISDLVSAGCKSRSRLSENPNSEEYRPRIEEAIHYLGSIQNTGIYWGFKKILSDLYQWNERVTIDNWETLDALIFERYKDQGWAETILQMTGVERSCTEYWRRKQGNKDHLLQYALEWAFFTRSQWGINDIPLFELERAWNDAEPSPPLPVTLGSDRPQLNRTIRNLNDVHDAIRHYVDLIPYTKVLATTQHISTDIQYRLVTDQEMTQALGRRDNASPEDRDVYASYILENFLVELEKHGSEIVYQFSIGAEPLPYETGSKLRQETVYELADIIERHPNLPFQAFLSNEHTNQSLCTLARELPNFSLAGYWWHNFFPGAIQKVIQERLDMLAANKQIGFFSDAYCLEWTYAKAMIVRSQLAAILTEKIEQGQYSFDEAIEISREIMYESPQTLLGMVPRRRM
jgi:hypothetical protein